MQARLFVKYPLRLFFWVILPFFLIEILMTVLDPYLFRGFRQYDPDIGFRVRSYYYFDGSLTNQFGFNDQDYSLQKPSGTFRILVVGDSFNWIGGRDGNYVGLLRQKLKERYGDKKIDVVNVGYPGTHTGEQVAMLKKFGLLYNPDLVVLGFFAGNDFLDAAPNRKTIVINDTFFNIDRRHEHIFLGYPIVLRSRLLMFIAQKYKVYSAVRNASNQSDAEAIARGKPTPYGTFSEDIFMTIERGRFEFCNLQSDRFQPNIQYIFQSIVELDDILKSRGIKFVVATYPDEFQVNQRLLNKLIGTYRIRAEDYDPSRPQDLLRTFLLARHIPYIDFLECFRAQATTQALYLFRNTHWNEAGNQLAAEILFNELTPQIEAVNRQPLPSR
jgi:acetyltransferase AlgX (SGNH hydrolase-like protein)